MISKHLRKAIGAIIGGTGVLCYVLGFFALSAISQDEMRAVHDGTNPASVLIPGIVLSIAAVLLILAGRVIFGDGDHRKSRTAFAVMLATLPVQALLLFGLKYYITCVSDLSKKIGEIFVQNTGFLEIVLIVLTLGLGIFFTLTRRATEYTEKPLGKVESNVRAGLLGMLGMAGYDICDVILTSYDGQKTAILVFESDEALEKAIDKGYDQEIIAACRAAEPEYEYQFEAKS